MDFNTIVAPLNLSNAELSRQLGVSDGHIADLRSGRRSMSLRLAAKLEALTDRTGLVAAVAVEKAAPSEAQ